MPTTRPFPAFNFRVEVEVPGIPGQLCEAAFAEVEGLEMSIDKMTIREGGNNRNEIHLNGPVTYGTLTLRRGMTKDFGLWKWMRRVVAGPSMSIRPDADVVVLDRDGEAEIARFRVVRCFPIRIKAASLNAKEGAIAIEELELAYESFDLEDDADLGDGRLPSIGDVNSLLPGGVL